MKRLYSLLIILLIGAAAHAQTYETNPDYKRANVWHFGIGAGIDFNSGTPVAITGGQTGHTWEGYSSICDTSGNLMFYTDGQTVWNKNHDVVENGTGLMAHTSSTQGSLLLQHPENDTMVFLFTTPSAVNLNTGLRYNIINTNIGNGRVVVKNKLLLTPTTEKLTAINHANGRDIWVIVHGYTSNSYFSYLLTKTGLVECSIESVTGNILEDIPVLWPYNTPGNLISNFQGNQIAAAIFLSSKVEVFNFNNSNGRLEIEDTIQLNSNVYCVVYNNNGNRLYIQTMNSNIDSSYIYYYENKTLTLVNKYKHGQIQFIVNQFNNIYIANMDSSHLSILENIDDVMPTFNKKGVELGSSISSAGLPNFNQSYFNTPSINFAVKLDCVSNTIRFYGQDTFQANTHSWKITKQGITMTENIKNPLIEFTDSGVYNVRYIASNSIRSDTVSKEVTILPKIHKDFLGNDTGWCNSIGSPIELQAPTGMHCYEWSTGEKSPQITVDTSGVYIAKITTPNFCVIYDTVIVSIDTIETITSNFLGEDKTWCNNLDTIVKLIALDDFLKYTWSNGNKEQEIVISEEGVYYVEAFKRNQCSNGGNLNAYDTIEIVLLNAPDKPILNREQNQDSLFINLLGHYTYNWYHNNTLLNDTTSYLILHDTGNFFLKITNSNNCINYSDTIHVATLGTDNLLFNSIKLYPNPTNGVFIVDVINSEYSFAIKDITGKVNNKGKLKLGINQIDISHLSGGIYFITIYNNEQSITYKLIKQTE